MARILKDVPQLAFAYFNFELTLCVLKVRNYTVHLLKLDGRMYSSFCIGKVGLCLFFGRQFLAASMKGTEYLISLSTFHTIPTSPSLPFSVCLSPVCGIIGVSLWKFLLVDVLNRIQLFRVSFDFYSLLPILSKLYIPPLLGEHNTIESKAALLQVGIFVSV